MRKDIQWLKEEIGELPCVDTVFNSGGSSYIDSAVPVMAVYVLINQLDEPEVLSDKWIDNNSVYASFDGLTGEYVHVDDLQNLLLPKQEILSQEWIDEHRESTFDLDEDEDFETVFVRVKNLQNLLVPKQELPVIPNYVAKWISIHHEQFDLYPALKRLENNALSWEDVYEWYRRNTHTFVNAYLTGKYEVEEEQRYYVLNNEKYFLLGKDKGHGFIFSTGGNSKLGSMEQTSATFELTEQEIKDYDERYWPFAVKVKEMEE